MPSIYTIEGIEQSCSTTEELAKYFGVCEKTIYRWGDSGDLERYRKGRGQYLYTQSAVDAMFRKVDRRSKQKRRGKPNDEPEQCEKPNDEPEQCEKPNDEQRQRGKPKQRP